MRSVLVKRFFVVLLIAMLLTVSLILASSLLVSRGAYMASELEDMSAKTDALSQLMVEYTNGNISRDAFRKMMESMVKAINATTIIIDNSGDIAIMYDASFNFNTVDTEHLRNLLSEEILLVLSGNTIAVQNIKLNNINAILVAKPLYISAGSSPYGGIFLIKDTTTVTSYLERTNMPIIWFAMISAVLLLFASSWQANRITEPLRNMADVASEMANGDLDVRVEGSESSGEVGLLARSLNNLCDRLSQTIYQLRTEKSQLNLILDSLSDGVVAVDGDGNITHYNPAIKHMFGAISVKDRFDLISDREIWDVFDKVYYTGRQETITYKLAGDRTLWIAITAVITDVGECSGVVGLFKDMTDVERMEETRREYVANISHELRTPLTAVRGLLEPLADGLISDEETKQRYYKTMLHEVIRLSRLINDMLMLSRLQSNTEYLDILKTDICELLYDVADGYTMVAAEKGIELKVDSSNFNDHMFAMTNPDRIEQVLIILIDNAMRYTKSGGSITLSIKSNATKFFIGVEDTGCGIPKKELHRIFERFYKVDKSRKEGGTGLGLSIACLIMERLGEKISVSSEVGVGTRFEFTLKRYVSNAIVLGPAEDEPLPEPQPIPIRHAPKKPHASRNRRSYDEIDAPYEVLDDNDKKK